MSLSIIYVSFIIILLPEILCKILEVWDKNIWLFQGDLQETAGTQYFAAYHDTNVNLKPEDGGHSLLLWI